MEPDEKWSKALQRASALLTEGASEQNVQRILSHSLFSF